MKTIQELLSAIDRVKGIQEASWNGEAYDIPWIKAIDMVFQDPIEKSIAFSLIHNCWNDTESWLLELNNRDKKQKLKKETDEQKAIKALYDRLDQGSTEKGTTVFTSSDMQKYSGTEFNFKKSAENSQLYRCEWPDGKVAHLYPHEIRPIL